jgi:hypothetical protein
MEYVDRNGNKWSIDKGDWKGYQPLEKKTNLKIKLSLKKFKPIVLLLVSLILILAFFSL